MYINSLLAISGALFAVAAAVPMAEPHGHHHKHRRDYVWVSQVEVVVETIPVTVTVWVEPGADVPEATPTTSSAPPPKVDQPEPSEPAATTPVAYTLPAAPAYTPAANPPAYTPAASPSSSTSVYVAPVPATTSTTVAPAPYVAPPAPAPYVAPSAPAPYVAPPAPAAYVAPTTSTTPAPAATSASSSGSSVGGMAAAGKMYTGDLTYYDVGLGACGETNIASDHVIAIPHAIFDAYTVGGNPNLNPLCNKTISITAKDGTKHTGTVVDRCPGCTVNDLDLSQDFFNDVTNYGDGRVGGMSWCFDN